MSTASGENREAAALATALTSEAQPRASETVPVHVVQSIRDELRQEKEKNEAFRNHFQMMQWQQQQQTPPPQAYNPFQGKDPKDSILVEDAARVFGDFANQLRNEFRSEIAEVKVSSKANDYKEVINKYLPKAAAEDPELIHEIKNSANPYKAAYLAAKASQAYQDDYAASKASKNASTSASQGNQDAERIVSNAKQSGNLSSVGNQATLSDRHQSYSRMSDEEFLKFKSGLRFKPVSGSR